MSFLVKRGYALVESASDNRLKILQLTAKGRKAQVRYFQVLKEIEERWRSHFGENAIDKLRSDLEGLMDEEKPSLLFRGMEPYPDGWRAPVRGPENLPHYPMVLHRGGFPDGS
jgi:hypothetical protein